MTCGTCGESYAVFGIAFYCVRCGALRPADRFTKLLALQWRILDGLDLLPGNVRTQMETDGAYTRFYEGTVTGASGASESFLGSVFRARVSDTETILRGRQSVFQRLDQASDLYMEHLGVQLGSLAPLSWAVLVGSVALRPVLVHNDGIVDDKYLQRIPDSRH
jgi:hypothetical protein